ncbi:unnamed protein product [Rotaria sp. Silwood1]|nr:unnamed protein product [Rotaria sp. Silwood1]CAF0906396.1 unnamed protein product [Rotaria sp. Silwood1]CAF3392044.1 unnamed protein product [Rotaria sp. Silwood1]CAF4544412.1 unnamed protein product [Rotaria sp. Silwood1]
MATGAIAEDEISSSPPTSPMFAAPDPDINQSTFDRNETIAPILSFGLITDIHYADHDDRWNYVKTRLRRYRNATNLVNEACNYWLNGKYPISFILQLGDLIDGVCFTNKTSVNDLNVILEQFTKNFKTLPIYHIWGNHELYNFTRQELLNGPLCTFDTKHISPAHYGTFEVCPNLRIIALDTYEVSALGVADDSEVYIQAIELLRKHNQNEQLNDPTGLRGHQRRFVQFNGGIASKQMDWLKEQLTAAKNRNEKVVIIGHIPIHPSACDHLDLLWNYKEVLDLLWIFDGTVLAYIAGHDHDGGYFRDRKNIHHLTLQAIVECDPNTNSFATVHVYKDCLLIEGVGRIGTYKIDCQL